MSSDATKGAESAGEPAAGAAISADPAETVLADTAPEEAAASGKPDPTVKAAQAATASGGMARTLAGSGKATQSAAAQSKAASDQAADSAPGADMAPVAGPVATGAAEVTAAAGEAATASAGSEAGGEATVVDAGAMTLVLDLEPDPDDAGQPGDEPVSKLAVAALVTSLVALVPVAVAFGVAALVGIRRSGRRGHGMATSALFLSAAWVIVAGAVATIGVVTHGFHKPVTIQYHEAAVFKLQTGDCINTSSGQLVSVLPCYTPHQAEVFATFALTGTAWPGQTTVSQEASSGCGDRLNGYLNPQLAVSLTQSYVYPNEDAWTAGTRTVICEVRATSGELTSSVRGAG